VRLFCRSLAALLVVFGVVHQVSAAAQTPASSTQAAAANAGRNALSSDDPVANSASEVRFGNARFTVLTPQLIRMEWSASGKFEDHASLVFINRRLPVPRFEHTISKQGDGQRLIIKTDALTLTYVPSGDGQFTAQDLSIQLEAEDSPAVWRPGEANPENLQGTTRTLDGARGSHTREPIGPGLISRAGWVLVDDTTRPLFDSTDFRFLEGEKSPWPWVMDRPADEQPGNYSDWYFFGYGHEYRKALGDFVRVAGRIPLPPRFAFGAWWSRYWSYSDQELDQLIRGFRENSTPLDVLVIDMDWHLNFHQLEAAHEKDQSGQTLGWTGYTWNKLLFPDPNDFLKQVHLDGLKATLNLHPASGIQPWEKAYPAMARAMGVDPATKKYIPFDPTNKKWATAYFDLVLHPLEKQGIDFWWLDWQQQPMMTRVPGLSQTWWLNYLHFTDQQREGKRPLLFHRWGGLGNHRYQIGFSGDTISVWDSLAFQPWFTATAANVGYAYWSHDIGGHMPGAVDPELFTRWVQFGAFSPILRTHTTKNPDSERRIWAYPEPYSSILRSTFQLRYALQPYLYTEGRRTYDTGVGFFHPLYYDWPNAEEAYTSKDEYMFGDEMLVSPVTTPADKASGLAAEQIWLPPGEWIEWPTGRHFTGPVKIERSFSIDQIPVYVKAGAIVPMQPAMLHSGEKPVNPLIVNVWPLAAGESSSYSLYEDSGVSVNYQRGVFARTPIHATESGDTLRVEIGPVEGGYPGMLRNRSYELRLPADWPPESVTVNGRPVPEGGAGKRGWTFEGNTLTTVIPTAGYDVAERVTIEVRRSNALMKRRNDLDGFAGWMTRLRGAYDALQQTWPVAWPPDALIDAMQTGDRIGYHPGEAGDEITHLHDMLPKAQAAVAEVNSSFAQKLDDYAAHMENNPLRPADMAAQKQSRQESMTRAEDLMSAVGK
jgi:alpha-glucosidase (family GH31 glycosyl hydrolase)